MRVCVYLLAVLVWVSGGCGQCTRRAPDDTDCSAVDTRSSCGLQSAGDLIDPPTNSRTCYRTCIDEGASPDPLQADLCQASFSTVVNQTIRPDIDIDFYSLRRIFSPNFNNGGPYRKSTICRYMVSCPGDRLLSHSITMHDLEPRQLCGDTNSEECIDNLVIPLPMYGGVQTTCGQEVDPTAVFQDGTQEMEIEFNSNRGDQFTGFEIFLWCVEPTEFNITGTGRRRRRRESSDFEVEENDPTSNAARGIDVPHAIAKRWYYHHYHCRHITVRRGDTVSYQWNNLFLRRPGEPVRRFTRVAVLFVCNRLFRYRRFIRNAEGSFGGYGKLRICRGRAWLIQRGVEHELRVNCDERRAIATLQVGLQDVLPREPFDVLDAEDIREMMMSGTTPPPPPTRQPPTSGELALRRRLALEFGRATNSLTRAVACAYQRVALRRDCLTGRSIPVATPTPTPKKYPWRLGR